MRNPSNYILPVIGAMLGFSVGYVIKGSQETKRPVNENLVIQKTYSIARVIDGDTLDINPGIEVLLPRIRLLGIDTPERGRPFCREASQKLEELVREKTILLERDVNDTDKYGRALRYVIIDNKNINIEMVRLGCARAYMHEGLKYENELLSAEKEAMENKKGIWGR